MKENYSIKCIRIHRPWFGTKHFYCPMKYDEVNLRFVPLQDDMEMPTVWGYETENEAWNIIDRKIIFDEMEQD